MTSGLTDRAPPATLDERNSSDPTTIDSEPSWWWE